MALSFGTGKNSVKGSASSSKNEQYKMVMGDNKVRLVGGVLPRYVYWVKGVNGDKKFPVECLEFNRDTEEFDRGEKDWVKEMLPDVKCGWSYSNLCIHDGTIKVFNFKKKLFNQIKTAAETLGDPADPETGWDIIFKKESTGPLPINVEYTLHQLKLKTRPLDDNEREVIKDLKAIDELIKRPTPDEQKEFLTKLLTPSSESENIDESIGKEFNVE